MKSLQLFFIVALIAVNISNSSAETEVVRLSEPVAKDASTETFGDKLNTNLPKISLSMLVENAQTYTNTPFLVETKIAKVCQKKGCFFIAQQGEHVLRVAFKDYGFFIPSDSGGKTVLLNGVLLRKSLSNAQAIHFNEDLKDNSVTLQAGDVYEIVASSVKIPLV